jgi:hypothetical protein
MLASFLQGEKHRGNYSSNSIASGKGRGGRPVAVTNQLPACLIAPWQQKQQQHYIVATGLVGGQRQSMASFLQGEEKCSSDSSNSVKQWQRALWAASSRHIGQLLTCWKASHQQRKQ